MNSLIVIGIFLYSLTILIMFSSLLNNVFGSQTYPDMASTRGSFNLTSGKMIK